MPEERLQRRPIPDQPASHQKARLPAWSISLAFHVALIVLVALLWQSSPKGTQAETGRDIGIAVVYETSAGEEYELVGSSASAENSTAELNAALPDAAAIGGENSQILEDLLPGDFSSSASNGTASGSLSMGDGGGSIGSQRGQSKVKTSVFGVEGEGTRFVYVFDRSDSMNGNGGKPLAASKKELLKSITSLSENHKFQVIFYNDAPFPYGANSASGPKLLAGTDQAKRLAGRFVRDMQAVGATQHVPAILLALGMAPDVVFFLTDADEPAPSLAQIERIQDTALRAGATLHAIQFGSGSNQSGGGWIRSLAESLGGKYRYVDVEKF